MNAPPELSPKAQSILSTPMFALTAALVPMFAPQVLSLRANNTSGNDYHKRQHPAVLPLFCVCTSPEGSPKALTTVFQTTSAQPQGALVEKLEMSGMMLEVNRRTEMAKRMMPKNLRIR